MVFIVCQWLGDTVFWFKSLVLMAAGPDTQTDLPRKRKCYLLYSR